MTINMNDSHIVSITQLKEFLKVAKKFDFKAASRKGKYEWINEILLRFGYFKLRKRDKAIVKRYIMQMTGISDAQLTRLISRKKKIGKLVSLFSTSYAKPRPPFYINT